MKGRQIINNLVNRFTPIEQQAFVLAYGNGEPNMPIGEVIKNIPDDRIDWATLDCEKVILRKIEAQFRGSTLMA